MKENFQSSSWQVWVSHLAFHSSRFGQKSPSKHRHLHNEGAGGGVHTCPQNSPWSAARSGSSFPRCQGTLCTDSVLSSLSLRQPAVSSCAGRPACQTSTTKPKAVNITHFTRFLRRARSPRTDSAFTLVTLLF